MKSRALASAALGAAIVLGATGCSMISPQSTTLQYSAADGINIPASGPIAVRNVLVVANQSGTVGNLVAAIVNPTTEAHTLAVQVGEGADAIKLSVRVAAGTTLSLGADPSQPPLTLEGIDSKPGATLPIYFQSGTAEGVVTPVPVLDGQLDYLRTLAPVAPGEEVVVVEPSPTATASATPESHSSGH